MFTTPFLVLYKIFGAIPFNFDRHVTNYLDYILMIIIPFFYFVVIIVSKTYNILIPDNNECLACTIGDFLFVGLGMLIYIVTFLCTIRMKPFFLKFLEEIYVVSNEIKWCTQNLPKENLKKNRFQNYLFIFGGLLYLISFLFDCGIRTKTYGLSHVLSVLFEDLPYLIPCLVQSQFIILVHEVSEKFIDINRVLEAISDESDMKAGQLKIFDIDSELAKLNQSKDSADTATVDDEEDEKRPDDDNQQKLKGKNLFKSDNKIFPSSKKLVKDEKKDTERFMVNVFKLHDKLCEIGVLTNCKFAVQIVTYMTVTFIIGVFGIFLETKVIFIVGGQRLYLDLLAASYVLWGVTFILIAYMILRMCCRAQNEAKKTALLVHEIMQKKPAFMLGNDVYYNRMKCFTLQYLHWENYFHFNGVGLFQLDYTFIFSAISAATSYLIVLLQFDLSNIM